MSASAHMSPPEKNYYRRKAIGKRNFGTKTYKDFDKDRPHLIGSTRRGPPLLWEAAGAGELPPER
jgi:hypothetical protein